MLSRGAVRSWKTSQMKSGQLMLPIDRKRLTRAARGLYVKHIMVDGVRVPLPTRSIPLPNAVLKDPRFIARLSFRLTPKVPRHEAMLVERLAGRRDWMIFLDNNMVDAKYIDGPLWAELLTGQRRFAL